MKQVVNDEFMGNLKKYIEKCKETKIKADTRMEELTNQKTGYENEVREFGFDPETLDEDIKKREAEMENVADEVVELQRQMGLNPQI